MKKTVYKATTGSYVRASYYVHVSERLNDMPTAQCGVVKSTNGSQVLISYITPCAIVTPDNYNGGGKWLAVRGLYSATTRRHLSIFAQQFGVSYSVVKKIAATDYIYNITTGEYKNVGFDNIEKTIQRAVDRSPDYFVLRSTV